MMNSRNDIDNKIKNIDDNNDGSEPFYFILFFSRFSRTV